MGPKTKVVYLGDLPQVAEALSRCERCDLTACVLENSDSPETTRRFSEITLQRAVPLIRVSSEDELFHALKGLPPFDLGILANFGIILKPRTLSIPAKGFVNAHLGLLPEYPGRYPIRDALSRGERVVGVTLHEATASPDAGRVLSTRKVSVADPRRPEQVFERLASLSAEMIVDHLSRAPSSH